MKKCARCGDEKSQFPRNRKSRDGLGSWCSDCCRDYMRGRKSDPAKRRAAARASEQRHPDRRRAREKVKDAVRSGKLPAIGSQACVDCGERAFAYDHYLGYSHPLAVQPVCSECHGKRSRVRGEHRREAAP